MTQRSRGTYILLVTDLLLVLLCVLHITALLDRPRVPFVTQREGGTVVISEILDTHAAAGLRRGDALLAVDGYAIERADVLDYITDFSAIGEQVSVNINRSGEVRSIAIRLIPHYSIGYVVIVWLIGLITFILAMYLLMKGPGDLTANVLHGSFVSLAVVVVLAWERVSLQSAIPHLASTVFFLAYAGVATLFFFFTAMFPRPKPGSPLLKGTLIFAPAVAFTAPTILASIRAHETLSLPSIDNFLWWFDIFHIVTSIYIVGGLLNFIHSYITSEFSAERQRLKWLLLGLCVGPTPFVASIVYEKITTRPLVPEIFTLPFLLCIPVAFIVSFLKYRVLDVEVVIKRTTAYAIVLALLVIVYVVCVGAVAGIVGAQTVEWSAVAAVLVALLFEPARRRVQRFVDRKFFRVHFDFREAQREFVEETKHSLDLEHLAGLVVNRTNALIPVERIGFFVVRQPGNRLHPLAHNGFDLLEQHGIRFQPEKLKTQLQQPVGLDDRIEPGIPHESGDERVFSRWGMALIFPMMSETFESLGFLVLGPKKSGRRFTAEEVDLMNTVTTQAGLAMERIALQKQLLLKEVEAQRLAELNRMKSEFVSYVSHEFRTPLTSIKMFSELLRGRISDRDKTSIEHLRIIKGESDRLNRMVSNVLDVARIESGVAEFRFKDMDIRESARRVMDTMSYQLKQRKFSVDFTLPKKRLVIHGDPDAVEQALINLIGNAVKYSGQTRAVKIRFGKAKGRVFCRIEDRGVGIPEEALPHIFERFYREPGMEGKVSGVGLGLPLVRHIMEVHGGSVEVRSKPGKGSTFTLLFPAKRNDETRKNNTRG
jgi:signal transduction histidine kinase